MTEKDQTSKLNLRKVAIPAVLVAGLGVGALVSPIGIASADDSDTGTEASQVDETEVDETVADAADTEMAQDGDKKGQKADSEKECDEEKADRPQSENRGSDEAKPTGADRDAAMESKGDRPPVNGDAPTNPDAAAETTDA